VGGRVLFIGRRGKLTVLINDFGIDGMSIRTSEIKDGIKIFECDSWRDFYDHVCFSMGDYDTRYIWRGQRNASWELDSSLSRLKINSCGHLDRFRKAIVGVIKQDFDLDSEDDQMKLWAIGQHFGLKTPLIDFTQFPFVALFFAFVECGNSDQEKLRAVFAIDWDNVSVVNFGITNTGEGIFREKIQNGSYDDELMRKLLDQYGINDSIHSMIEKREISRDIQKWMCQNRHHSLKKNQLGIHIDYSGENVRIQRQGGILIHPPENLSIEKWCQDYAKYRDPAINRPLLLKFVIPDSDRGLVIRSLNKMNINYASLFPDLMGVSQYCNMALEEGKHMFSSFRGY